MTARTTATMTKSATAPDVKSAESFVWKRPPPERILTIRKTPIKNHGRLVNVSHPKRIIAPGENVFMKKVYPVRYRESRKVMNSIRLKRSFVTSAQAKFLSHRACHFRKPRQYPQCVARAPRGMNRVRLSQADSRTAPARARARNQRAI